MSSVGQPYKGFCKAEDCAKKGIEQMVRGKNNPRCHTCSLRQFQAYGRDKVKTVRHKPTGEAALFTQLWLKRDHYSQIGGEYLGNIMKPILFSHVLSKGSYAEARLDPDNIMLATEQEHYELHNIARSDLIKKHEKWKTYFEYYDKIKSKYDEKKIKESRRASRM